MGTPAYSENPGFGVSAVTVSRSKTQPDERMGLKNRKGERLMKVLVISFAVGLFVGILYGVIRVKSPAPPIVALLGLLGMVLGEQLGGWILAKKVSLTHAASVCLVGKHWDQRANMQSVVSVQPHADGESAPRDK